MWLNKKSADELGMGVKVEAEHAATVAKIKASIKDGKITMSNEEIYKSIAEDHILGEHMPDYYTRLKKLEDEARRDYAKGVK